MHNAIDDLNDFFARLHDYAMEFEKWTGMRPKRLVINPDIIGRISRIEGFYQRPELTSLVPQHAPVVRYIRLFPHNVVPWIVEIQEDWGESFYHFE